MFFLDNYVNFVFFSKLAGLPQEREEDFVAPFLYFYVLLYN
ncbi:MAG: hypothetical protein ACUVTR_01390 [Dehalococcoidia bacterium]